MAGNTLNVRGVELPRDTEGASHDMRSYDVTYEEMQRLIKRTSGRTIYVRAGQFAPSKVSSVPGQRRGYEVSGLVPVAKRVALKYLDDAYGRIMRETVNVHVTVCDNCMFIG
jgi:hypothetical protein